MHDDVRANRQGRSWWPLWDEPGGSSRTLTGIIFGVLIGGAIGMIVDGPAMMALGISLGSGVGWGLSRQYWEARQSESYALHGMFVGGALGGLLGAGPGLLLGWPIAVMLGIAIGVALGANAGHRIGASKASIR